MTRHHLLALSMASLLSACIDVVPKDFAECLTEACSGTECDDKIKDDWCYVDNQCYQAGQSPPGELCQAVCRPELIQRDFVKPCGPGQTCSGDNVCAEADAGDTTITPETDASVDTIAPEVTPDTVADPGPDAVPDAGPDTLADTTVDTPVDFGLDPGPLDDIPLTDSTPDSGDDATAVDTGTDTVQDTGVDAAQDTGVDVPPLGPGQCLNVADLDICNTCGQSGNPPCGGECPYAADFAQSEATNCALSCIADADPASCSNTCIITATGLSSGCADCFTQTILCSIDNCLNECVTDPDSPACVDCQVANCLDDYYACTGFESDCADGVDNNGDGSIDCGDPGCLATSACGGQYAFSGEASFVTSMVLGAVDMSTPACGFDLDGDGAVDNAYTDLASSMGTLLGDTSFLATTPNQQYAAGTRADLIEWVGFSGQDDPSVVANALVGAPDGATVWDFASALAGNGLFTVNANNFAVNVPKHTFSGATSGSTFTGSSQSVNVLLPVPVGPDVSIAFTLRQAMLSGDIQMVPTGVAVSKGELGGAISIEELMASLNAFVDTQCGCLSVPPSEALIDYIDDATQPTCNAPDPSLSTCGPSDNACSLLAQFCSAVVLVVVGDIDLDGNGETTYDGISVGLCVEAVGASITGISP